MVGRDVSPPSDHVPLYRGPGINTVVQFRRTRAVLPWFSVPADASVPTPPMPVGVAAVVTWNAGAGQVELWAIGLRVALERAGLGGDGVTLSKATLDSLGDRIRGLSHHLPALWTAPLPEAAALVCVPIDAVKPDDPRASVRWPGLVQGDSLQAAALLAILSSLTEQALPRGFAVSARVGNTGVLQSVEHLEKKRAGLKLLAPELELVSLGETVQTFQHLLQETGLASALLACPEDQIERRLSALEEIVVARRNVLHAFGAVRRAAERVLAQPLTEEQRMRARFALAIFHRHDGLLADMPSWDQVGTLSGGSMFGEQLADLVQHHADHGEPLPAGLQKVVEEAVARVRGDEPSWPASIKLLGAMGRAISATMQPDALRQAFDIQVDAVSAWERHRLFGEISFPLSEVYRLAGALLNRDDLEVAEGLRRDWDRRVGARTQYGGQYVDLANGRAQVLLFEAGLLNASAEADALLRPLLTGIEHLRPAARRWLHRLNQSEPAPVEGVQGILAKLDDIVLKRRDASEAAALLVQLCSEETWAQHLPHDIDLALLTRASPY